MSEPITASLERLRNARIESAEIEPPQLESELLPDAETSLPIQALASRRQRRASNLPQPTQTETETETEFGVGDTWAAAAQGKLANLDDTQLGKPRLALGARTALAAVLAILALGGGVFSAHLLAAPAAAKSITIASDGQATSDAATPSATILDDAEAAPANPNPNGEPETSAQSAATNTVIVHVAGAVVSPGIVELPAGARVANAVDQAGGASAEAELTAVNLARVLVDGEQIRIPVAGEAITPAATAPEPAQSQLDLSQVRDESGLINLNQAGPALLQELPGIGPALANRIIEYREANGGFNAIADLERVSGIGPAVMNDVRDKVTV